MIYRKEHAFTLVELMTVVAVAAILMAIAVPTFLSARNNADANACTANLEIIRSATREWALDNPGAAVAAYPITTTDVDGYIDSGFSSLDEPDGGSYATAGVVVTIDGSGNIPNPTCSTGTSGHSL